MRSSRRSTGSAVKAMKGATVHAPTDEILKPIPQPNMESAAAHEPTQQTSVNARNDSESSLQSKGSVEESEVLALMVPSVVVEEEKHLHEEHGNVFAKETPKAPSLVSSTLDKSRFSALEHLLRQSETYSQFLAEQMRDYEKQLAEEAREFAAKRIAAEEAAQMKAQPETDSKQKGKGGKRKRADNDTIEAKKAKITLTPTQELLPTMKVELRDYQLKGVKWLISLYQNGVNGILADQMGLGKTVQTIGFLSHIRTRGIFGPYMVVGPLSTLPNWVNEFHRFTPDIPVMLYHGTKAEREELRDSLLQHTDPKTRRILPSYPVIVTSYEIIVADAKYLAKTPFKYVVVDEGHRLKNFNCRLIRELKTIPMDNKLLLSGTPLQNNLSELWSLLNFLMPEVFGSLSDFEAWFDFSNAVGQSGADQEILAAEQRNKVVSKLHAILRPFMLRRLKADVDISLPPKREIILYANMTETQKKINQQIKDKSLLKDMTALAEAEGGRTATVTSLNNMLMQMRKNCNHPDLITSAFTTDPTFPPAQTLIDQCGKLQLLDKLLTKLHEKKHKVLVFSQMTRVLDLLESYLEDLGHRACRLDGSVSFQDRQAAINDFNSDAEEPWVFLLSTRAGGLGINLTAADTVIIYDSDWNPHQDLQAMDRCHRIGQKKPVLVFRLATSHSVEGRMLKRAADKMALERLVIKKGAFKEAPQLEEEEEKGTSVTKGLSATELMDMLQTDFAMDDLPQSGVVSNKMLEKLLDRTDMAEGKPTLPYPTSGVGYEVLQSGTTATGVLKNINK